MKCVRDVVEMSDADDSSAVVERTTS